MISDYWRFLLSAGDVHVRNQKHPKIIKSHYVILPMKFRFFFYFNWFVCFSEKIFFYCRGFTKELGTDTQNDVFKHPKYINSVARFEPT